MPISSTQITLFNGQVAVKSVESTSSPNGIKLIGEGNYGIVTHIDSTVTMVAVNDFVAFRKQERNLEINYDDESYFIISQDDILYKELTPP